MDVGDGKRERTDDAEHTVFPNIKQLLDAGRNQLEVGELLAAPTFDLQTAMSAREIGDPKMDRCSAPGVDTRGYVERIAAGEGRLDLTDREVILIMDRLVQMEIGWHDRYLLCQTVRIGFSGGGRGGRSAQGPVHATATPHV